MSDFKVRHASRGEILPKEKDMFETRTEFDILDGIIEHEELMEMLEEIAKEDSICKLSGIPSTIGKDK